MNTNFSRRILSVIGVSLLLLAGAACSSDSKTDDTSRSAATTSATTDAPATGRTGTTTDATVTTQASATTDVPGTTDDNRLDSVPLPTATDDREAIVEYVANIAEAAGIQYDEQCVTDLIAQMSDADAALVADNARHGGEGADPQLSAEGEAIGDQVENCAIEPTTTTG